MTINGLPVVVEQWLLVLLAVGITLDRANNPYCGVPPFYQHNTKLSRRWPHIIHNTLGKNRFKIHTIDTEYEHLAAGAVVLSCTGAKYIVFFRQ